MGVSGLLPLLKSIQKPTELKKFRGLTLGVDAYGWLHRAAFSCAVELGQGIPTDRYVTTAMHRVRMLRHFGITPYMVFDGDYLPSKGATEESRAKSREQKKKLAMELLSAGKIAQATQEFQKCVDITPEMAATLIQQLKQMDIPYVVAPYEADAQLVYLECQGLIDGIISDDSDLLVFGAKRLLTKLDRYGNCIEINRRDFCACREVSLTGWTDADFRRMAILSGCDYLEGLPSVGLKTAYRMLRKSKTPERVVKMLQFQGKRVSENYMTLFYQAELTFLHQWVFCPTRRELVHLTELDGSRTAEEMPYIGSYVETSTARAIAKGDMDPITKLPFNFPTTPTKRRHSQTTTAAAAPIRPDTKPIKSFFKRHDRIPMGEMDPNCFSVDPQQVAQITHGGLVPRVFPLPRPYMQEQSESSQPASAARTTSSAEASARIHRRRTEPISSMLARMASSPASKTGPSNSASSPHTSSSSKLEHPGIRPSKKVRLCDENNDQEGSPKKSRFFAKPKLPRSPRRAKSDAYLLSDDSIEEALLSLPDIDGWKAENKPKKSISIFKDSSQTTSQSSSQGTSQQTSQASSLTEPTDLSQTSMAASDVGTPLVEEVVSLPKLTGGSSIPESPYQLNLQRFSCSSTPISEASSRRSSIFSTRSIKSVTPSTAPSTAASRPTPLQRLAAKAFSGPVSPQPRNIKRPAAKPSVPTLPVNPPSVPLPKVDLAEMEALTRPLEGVGSEDQIIPDSDEEAEDDVEDGRPRKRLDLSRFAFALA